MLFLKQYIILRRAPDIIFFILKLTTHHHRVGDHTPSNRNLDHTQLENARKGKTLWFYRYHTSVSFILRKPFVISMIS